MTKQFKPNKSDITVSIGFMSLAASLVSIFLLTQHLNLTWPASLLKCLEEGKCICGIWLFQFFSHPPTCSCLAKRSFADRDIAGNSECSHVAWYWFLQTSMWHTDFFSWMMHNRSFMNTTGALRSNTSVSHPPLCLYYSLLTLWLTYWPPLMLVTQQRSSLLWLIPRLC